MFSTLNKDDIANLSMNNLPSEFARLGFETRFKAKNPSYSFNLLDDCWEIGRDELLDLTWTKEESLEVSKYIAVRLFIGIRAQKLSVGTVQNDNARLRKIGANLNSRLCFQRYFNGLAPYEANRVRILFKTIDTNESAAFKLIKEMFKDIIEFTKIQTSSYQQDPTTQILCPKKGVYSEEEEEIINNSLRVETASLLNSLDAFESVRKPFGRLRYLIGLILLRTIFRRPSQLSQMKWCDVLKVGQRFKDHRFGRQNSTPVEEFEFSDVDQLHLRIFKGKTGEFRGEAEYRSIRLEPELSRLILIYRTAYKNLLLENLQEQAICLSDESINEVIARCPLFPQMNLFEHAFQGQSGLFKEVSYQSDIFHCKVSKFGGSLRELSESFNLSSSRNPQLRITNNRSRHTVLTSGAWQGLSRAQLCRITGVGEEAIKPYIELDVKGRVLIDEAMAKNSIVSKFSLKSVKDLQNETLFSNELDEPIGAIEDEAPCNSCQAKLAKPLGCYGCDNFRPLIEADHSQNLRRIEQKIDFNKETAPSATLQMLARSAVYIRATIALIREQEFYAKGISNDSPK